MSITSEDLDFIKQAIEASKKSRSESDRISPMVGVVVVKDGKVLAIAWRGQQEPTDHAEFIALEKLSSNETFAGSTVYTTLEPCTKRNPPKVACVNRILDRRVRRVVIGMLDTNPSIQGKGYQRLRDHNIELDMFPSDLADEVEDLNRDFRRYIESHVKHRQVDAEFIERYRHRDIDEWYKAINYIYADRNFYREPVSLFAHLVEVIGGLSYLASGKKRPGAEPEAFLPKALAWWFTLCGKMGVTKVSDLLWLKFPQVCPYCQRDEHDATICSKKKKDTPEPQWDELRRLGRNKNRPTSLGEWQRMFRRIYKPHHKPDFESTFARLSEELGELAEAIRVFPASRGYFISEAADVFAWLMNIQNNIDFSYDRQEEEYGKLLEEQVCRAYPDYCLDCSKQRCICQPILEKTIGRLAHEMTVDDGLLDPGGIFMHYDNAKIVFKPPS